MLGQHKRLRIGIDASPALGSRGGVGWYTYRLLEALSDAKDDEVELVCYVRPGSLDRARAAWRSGTWQQHPTITWVEAGRTTLRWRGMLDRLDLYHGTNFKLETRGCHGSVVTVHDLWLDRYPQYSKKRLGQRLSFYRTRRTAWQARKVITISQHSANDLEALYGLPSDRIVLIPCGISPEFSPTSDQAAFQDLRRRLDLPDEPYILFVGGASPRKNHRTLLEAYAQARTALDPYRLVMVGDPTHRFGDIRQAARTLAVADRVYCVGHVSSADLVLLYSDAELFVFPSIYEGFGMPVLEAMACGTPVVASNRTSTPEVAGDAALLVDPEDSQALADAMLRVLADVSLREALKLNGFERVKQFSWEQAARRTLDVYREICGLH